MNPSSARHRSIVVLGSSLSALGVVRDAHSNNLDPVVFDTERGIATRSSVAHVEFLRDPAEEALLSRIRSMGDKERRVLIGTSDKWLRFIMKHREELENSYERILHPKNSSLGICLDKKDFLEWCGNNEIPVPSFHIFTREKGVSCCDGNPEIRFPLLLRPRATDHSAGSGKIPKAMEVRNQGELRGALGLFFASGADVVATLSLLGQRVTQFSVPAARSHEGMVSFVVEKMRPLPLQCAVGTYVRLHPDSRIEGLARNVLERLEYEGIAEVEILRSHDDGRDYVVEVNARPWIQYALATRSGHDFLRFVLDPGNYDPSKEMKSGKAWINFWDDLFVCFSGSIGLVRKGHVGFLEYLASLFRANVHSEFDFYDPWPAVYTSWENFRKYTRRMGKP